MEEVIAKDTPLLLSALDNLKTTTTDSNSHVKHLLQKLNNDNDTDRSNGLSFLEMKLQLLLEYLINLTYMMLLKIDGRDYAGKSSVERLVEIRTVLEKIRPINKKLSYQIDKLIKLATADLGEGQLHPLSYKPKLGNFADEDGTNEDEEENQTGQGSVYVAPKLTAVPYDDENTMTKKQKQLEKNRKKNLSTALLQDLRDEYGDEPEEIFDGRGGAGHSKFRKRQEEREQYEEDNLKRLLVTKKDKLQKRKVNELDQVVKLGSMHMPADGNSDSDDGEYKIPKKRKKKGKVGKAKNFKKNKRGRK